MAHFTQLDENNIVIQTIVIDNDEISDENGNESESAGIEICRQIVNDPNSTWLQTSFNSNIRSKFAGIGDLYIPDRDCFVEGKPHESWILNMESLVWEPPIPYPDDYNDYNYFWDEDTDSWLKFEHI